MTYSSRWAKKVKRLTPRVGFPGISGRFLSAGSGKRAGNYVGFKSRRGRESHRTTLISARPAHVGQTRAPKRPIWDQSKAKIIEDSRWVEGSNPFCSTSFSCNFRYLRLNHVVQSWRQLSLALLLHFSGGRVRRGFARPSAIEELLPPKRARHLRNDLHCASYRGAEGRRRSPLPRHGYRPEARAKLPVLKRVEPNPSASPIAPSSPSRGSVKLARVLSLVFDTTRHTSLRPSCGELGDEPYRKR
jgi:hypothetical protein